jgi:hypothetical protein
LLNVKREYCVIFEYYQIVIMDIMDGETPVSGKNGREVRRIARSLLFEG